MFALALGYGSHASTCMVFNLLPADIQTFHDMKIQHVCSYLFQDDVLTIMPCITELSIATGQGHKPINKDDILVSYDLACCGRMQLIMIAVSLTSCSLSSACALPKLLFLNPEAECLHFSFSNTVSVEISPCLLNWIPFRIKLPRITWYPQGDPDDYMHCRLWKDHGVLQGVCISPMTSCKLCKLLWCILTAMQKAW